MSKLESHLSLTQRLYDLVSLRVSTRALQQGVVLLFATLIGNVLQYLFHFLTGRLLGPTEYGVLASLLALAAILTVPTGIAQTVITQYVAGYFARQEMASASGFISTATKLLAVAGLVIFALVVVASPVLATVLNIPSIWPVIAMASFFLFAGPLTSLTGVLQGLQRFYGLAAQSILGPGIRLLAGFILILFGLGAAGALSATAASNLIVLSLTVLMLRDLFHTQPSETGLEIRQVTRYTGLVFWGTLAFAVLTNVDLVIVKHFFDPLQAGYYSAASVLGKTILSFPVAVATVMFPKTSFRHALGQNASDLARQSGVITAGLCGLGAVFLFLFQGPAVQIMFGDDYRLAAPLVGLYGATMALFALVQILFNYHIAQQDARFVWLVVGAAALLTGFLVLFHSTLEFVIVTIAITGAMILLISELWLDAFGFVGLIKTTFR